jgi:hypothetical protein
MVSLMVTVRPYPSGTVANCSVAESRLDHELHHPHDRQHRDDEHDRRKHDEGEATARYTSVTSNPYDSDEHK